MVAPQAITLSQDQELEPDPILDGAEAFAGSSLRSTDISCIFGHSDP